MSETFRHYINLLESANSFPLKSFKKLWHVGSLDPEKKRNNSHEGSGLSVSVNPDEWRKIGRGAIQGNVWELTKTGNKFLDYIKLSPIQRDMIADWAIQNEWATKQVAYRVSWEDESGDEVYADYTSIEDAKEQAYDEDDIIEIDGILIGTDKLRQRTRNKAEPVLVPDLIATIYGEDILNIDGIWWNEILDVVNFSAPRGVIFPSMLSTWTIQKIQ
ncbi:MAG: hypothetical protein WC284_18535 [Candidimonas sp.]